MIQNKRKTILELAKELKTPQQNLAHLKTLIKKTSKLPIDFNTKIYRGRTLLHYAVIGRNSGVIPLLVKIGVNPNLCDDDFNTPLHFAIINNAYYAVYELLKLPQIDKNATSEFEQTPLHKAVITGNLDIIKLLVKSGADFNLVDEKNLTPFDYAMDEGEQSIINYLKDLKMKGE
ncbi:MAG: ankyrin repeat domain-containing protein [Bacilli bacterium]